MDTEEIFEIVIGIIVIAFLIFGGIKTYNWVKSWNNDKKIETVDAVTKVEKKEIKVEKVENEKVEDPKNWSELLKTMPKKMKSKQEELKNALNNIKKIK